MIIIIIHLKSVAFWDIAFAHSILIIWNYWYYLSFFSSNVWI